MTLANCRVLALILSISLGASAQEIIVLGGATRSEIPEARSFGLALSYAHDLGPYLAAGVTYKNEGHVPAHHRDGHAAMLWLKAEVLEPELSLAAGAGPYHYFDTTVAEGGRDFADAHGWGFLYGATATWRARRSPWIYQLRIDRVETRHNLDTTSLLLGIGYRLDQDGSFAANSAPRARARDHGDEIVLAAGQTIVNSFESQSALARTVEYRHAFGPVVRASIGWINEGDARLIRRDGVVVQGWLEPSFYRDRLTLGLGYGAYLSVDRYRPGERDLMGVLTTSASYHLGNHWVGRFSWHRIASRIDRDSDIILLGMGYRY